MSDSRQQCVITRETTMRLASDVRDIYKHPLHSEGIYYEHDESDLLKGYAMIIGPEDTPYSGGYYFFKFAFPSNYPHSPPKAVFHTNNGSMRMHPNLYKSGNVCLSVLNTWHGDQWDGCQTISSILLTIRHILTKDPLTHEPGLGESHPDFFSYTQLVAFYNIRLATIDILSSAYIDRHFSNLLQTAKQNFIDDYDKKMKALEDAREGFDNFKTTRRLAPPDTLSTRSIYNIPQVRIDYDVLVRDLASMRQKLLTAST